MKRPSAIMLLEHEFVKKAKKVELLKELIERNAVIRNKKLVQRKTGVYQKKYPEKKHQKLTTEEWDWDVSNLKINRGINKPEEKQTSLPPPSPQKEAAKAKETRAPIARALFENLPTSNSQEQRNSAPRVESGTFVEKNQSKMKRKASSANHSSVNYLLNRWEKEQFAQVKDQYDQYLFYLKQLRDKE